MYTKNISLISVNVHIKIARFYNSYLAIRIYFERETWQLATMAATTATIRENNKLLTATTLAKFIQYKNAALPASRSPTKVQSPQTVCVFCSFRFVSLKLNKMRIAAKANAKR